MKSKLSIFFVKAVFAIPLFLFGLWLLQMLYTPGLEDHKAGEAPKHAEAAEEEGIFKKRQGQT
jgi:hypothetical protein